MLLVVILSSYIILISTKRRRNVLQALASYKYSSTELEGCQTLITILSYHVFHLGHNCFLLELKTSSWAHTYVRMLISTCNVKLRTPDSCHRTENNCKVTRCNRWHCSRQVGYVRYVTSRLDASPSGQAHIERSYIGPKSNSKVLGLCRTDVQTTYTRRSISLHTGHSMSCITVSHSL